MEAQFSQLGGFFVDWAELIAAILESLGLPVTGNTVVWSIVQLAIVALAASLAVVASRIMAPRLEAWLRDSGFGPRRMRAGAVILRRLTGINFSVFLWLGVLAMRAATWQSRSYFLHLAATLVTAWVVISIVSRIIRNRALARIVEVVGWILVTLELLGILPEAMALMDSLALEINEFRVSLLTLVQGVLVLSVLVWGALALSALLDRQLQGNIDFTPTMRVLLGKLGRFALITFAVMIGLYSVGIDFTALTLISGAIGVGLGFGLQKVVSNLVSGIILLLDKSIKPGDVISVGETFGWITSLNARYASVSMRDGREILIPNEDLITQQVQNWSYKDPFVRIDIKFGVSYSSDPHEVKKLAVAAARAHPRIKESPPDYPVVCHITGFGDSSIDFVLRFFITDPANGLTNIRGDVFLALWDTFKQNNISIPFPHREVILNQDALDAVAGRAAEKRGGTPGGSET